MSDESTYYPNFLCWRAPLRPHIAPWRDCTCKVCVWASGRQGGPVKPGTEAWDALLARAGAKV